MVLNFFFGSIFLVLLSPVFITVALAVLVFDGRPVIFTQRRLGLGGKPFRLYKFRTMKVQLDSRGLAKATDVTAVGRYLRILSLDEMPQLWNVITGDMNFVGPRPLLEAYRHLYNNEQFRRHEVRPGITGLAQINGRNSLTWEEKFELDLEYVDTRSVVGDLVILVRTVPAVFCFRNLAAGEETWVEPFRGSEPKATNGDTISESPEA